MGEKECLSHIPMHTGSGEVVCMECGEPCNFLPEKDRKDEKVDDKQ